MKQKIVNIKPMKLKKLVPDIYTSNTCYIFFKTDIPLFSIETNFYT